MSGGQKTRAITKTAEDVRVVVADDQRLSREALAYLLSSRDGVAVVGEAASAEESLERWPARIRRASPIQGVISVSASSHVESAPSSSMQGCI